MITPDRIGKAAEQALSGWPGGALSGALLAIAGFAVIVALVAPATLKIAVLAWLALP